MHTVRTGTVPAEGQKDLVTRVAWQWPAEPVAVWVKAY